MRGNFIAQAKISRPQLADIYVRRRLIDELKPLKGCRTYFVSAPAGSGKTTLVASYLDETNLAGIWYSLNSGDTTEPAAFFHNL